MRVLIATLALLGLASAASADSISASFTNLEAPATVQLGQSFNVQTEIELDSEASSVIVELTDALTGEVLAATSLPINVSTQLAVRFSDEGGREMSSRESNTTPGLYVVHYVLPVLGDE